MMGIMRLLDKLMAVLRRDFFSATRYRAAIFLAISGGILEIVGLYYLSKAIGPEFRPDGMSSYPFLLVGTGLYTFLLMGISAFVSAIQDAQQAGTLEVLMTSSTPPNVLLLLSASSSFAGKGVSFAVYLLGGLLISGLHLAGSSLLPSCIVLGLSIVIAVAIGLGAAAVQLAVRKGSAVVWLLGSAVWLLTGAMFPVSALPRGLQRLAVLLPLTHSLNGMRLALFGTGFSAALTREMLWLFLYAVTLLPTGVLVFRAALRGARQNGALFYC